MAGVTLIRSQDLEKEAFLANSKEGPLHQKINNEGDQPQNWLNMLLTPDVEFQLV